MKVMGIMEATGDTPLASLLLVVIVVGCIFGALAGFLTRSNYGVRNVIINMLLGSAGSIVGGWLIGYVLSFMGIPLVNFLMMIVVYAVGAILMVVLVRHFMGGRFF